MELKEIYSRLSEHMIKGMMIHEQMANYYGFLGLDGYRRCHEYHFLAETKNYRKLNGYFIHHHNMLILETRFDSPEIIPESWYDHTRQDVDAGTKKNAVKNGLEKWVSWEKDTKHLYEDMYKELMDIGEVASACFIKCFIADVDKELKKAEKYHLNKEALGYDIHAIISDQDKMHDKYKKKCKKVSHD